MGWWSSFKIFVASAVSSVIGAVISAVVTGAAALLSVAVVAAAIVVVATIATVCLVDHFVFSKDQTSTTNTSTSSVSSPVVPNYVMERSDYDYHASIHLNDVHFCSGAFIGTYFIVTVAQCMYTFVNNEREKSKLKVYVAINQVPSYSKFDYAVDEIIVHPQFKASELTHNIAVLKTKEKITEPSHVYAIGLPNPDMKIEGTTVLVNGFKNLDTPSVLTGISKSNMTIIKQDICNRDFTSKIKTSWKFCAVPSPGWKPCQVSRGAPAANTDKILIGLFVMGNSRGCGEKLPEIFLDISKCLDFIRDATT